LEIENIIDENFKVNKKSWKKKVRILDISVSIINGLNLLRKRASSGLTQKTKYISCIKA